MNLIFSYLKNTYFNPMGNTNILYINTIYLRYFLNNESVYLYILIFRINNFQVKLR